MTKASGSTPSLRITCASTTAHACDKDGTPASKEFEMSSKPWPSVSGHHGVVVGIDGSPTSRVAVDWAARDAELRDVPLTVVHAMSTVVIGAWADFPMSPEFWKSRDRRAEELVREALGWVADAISESPRIEVRHQVLPAAVVPTMVDMSKDADLVVVGCRGLGGVQNLLLGSVSSALVHHAHCPVAVIHDEDPLMPDFANAPVAVGIDGSPASELAVAIAFEEASHRGVDLVAVHVWSDHTDDFADGYWANLGDWAEEELSERLAGWTERYPDVTVHRVVKKDRPVRTLLEQAEKSQLLVVGSHGRGGFAGLLLGSVSSSVAHAARMPVIVARQS
jgi:nucleotide-binding universal stress UspA family protein